MNNGMVLTQAAKFAERLKNDAGGDVDKQVDRAFRIALARPPDAFERRSSAAFIKRSPTGLIEFCHALVNLNEFVFRQ